MGLHVPAAFDGGRDEPPAPANLAAMTPPYIYIYKTKIHFSSSFLILLQCETGKTSMETGTGNRL